MSRRTKGPTARRSSEGNTARRVEPDFLELLRELVATFVSFDRAHKGAIDILVASKKEDSQRIDTLLDPLVLACLDAAYAIKEITNTKRFEFINKEDPTGLLHDLDRARARKRHPQKFIPNTINSGRSHASGVRICYGRSAGEWMCQLVFFNGAFGEGETSALTKGFIYHEDWHDRPQVVYFIGADYAVNLSLLLYNFRSFVEKLLGDFVQQCTSDGELFILTHLSSMQQSMGGVLMNTIYFTLVDAAPHSQDQ